MKQKDDLYYIQKVLEGDTAAYSYLVGRYQDNIYSQCRQLLKEDQEAADTAQEVFIKAFTSLKSFKGTAKFSTWIFRIAYNMCITKLRKKKVMRNTADESKLERLGGFEEHNTDKEDEQREVKLLQKSIRQLKEEEQLMLTLHYFEEKSVEEISIIMSLSLSNVKVKLFRTRKKLKDIMDKENVLYYNSLN